jgi:hypothetical protein
MVTLGVALLELLEGDGVLELLEGDGVFTPMVSCDCGRRED